MSRLSFNDFLELKTHVGTKFGLIKTLAGWMSGDNHSIVVNKGVCNTLDANVCTMLVTGFKASMLEFRPFIDWITSANPKKMVDAPH